MTKCEVQINYMDKQMKVVLSQQNHRVPKGSYPGNSGYPAFTSFRKNKVIQVAQRQNLVT